MSEQMQKNVLPDRIENSEELNSMAKALEEIQMSLEPIRDQALDRKAFFTGYSQCAEDMIKVIVAKMSYLKKQSENKQIEEKKQSENKQIEEKKQLENKQVEEDKKLKLTNIGQIEEKKQPKKGVKK